MPAPRVALLCALFSLVACSASPPARDCPCPQMVIIPAGSAVLGAAGSDPFRNRDEQPQRTVRIERAFAVSQHEITRGEYAAFVRATNRLVSGPCLTDRVKRGVWEYDAGTNFRDPGFPQQDDHPVACVSWDDAQAYVAWLNTQSPGGFRLLTESEWEYVARAGAAPDALWPWGSDSTRGCREANTFDRTTMAAYAGMDRSEYKVFDPMDCSDGWLNTAPVGSLAPNNFGVHDMIGNVAEWIDGCHTKSHEDAAAPGDCTRRLVKGGSWGTLAHNVRVAERVPYPAVHQDDSVGIRVARTLD